MSNSHADAPSKEIRKRGIVFSRVALTGREPGDVAHNDMILIKLEMQYVVDKIYSPFQKSTFLNKYFKIKYFLLFNVLFISKLQT